jgi:hypothetical protein
MTYIKWIGWGLFLIGIACIAIGAIGLVEMQKHPCYGAVKRQTGSSLLSLRAAAGCQNNGRPFPITGVVKLLPQTGSVSPGRNPYDTPKVALRSTLGWIFAALSIGLALVGVFAGSAFYSETQRGFTEMADRIDLASIWAGFLGDTAALAGSPLTPSEQTEVMGASADLIIAAREGDAEAEAELARQNAALAATRVDLGGRLGATPGVAVDAGSVIPAAAPVLAAVTDAVAATVDGTVAAAAPLAGTTERASAASDATAASATWADWGRGLASGVGRVVSALGEAAASTAEATDPRFYEPEEGEGGVPETP